VRLERLYVILISFVLFLIVRIRMFTVSFCCKNQLLSIKKILLLSPIEQFDFTLEDIRKIVSNSSLLLTDEWIQAVRKEREERITDEGGQHQLTIHTDDSNRKSSTNTSFTNVLQKELQSTYCKNNGDNASKIGGVVCSCHVTMCSKQEYSIHVSRKDYSNVPKGMAGSWIGTFNLLLSSSQGNENDTSSSSLSTETSTGSYSTAWTLSGRVQLKAHVHENDNVQMTTTVALDSTNVVSASNETEQGVLVATAVAKQLLLWDKEILRSVQEFYDTMEDTMLKSCRRILPHSRKRMDWDVKSHRVVSNLHDLNI
jgi:hypothetical protein